MCRVIFNLILLATTALWGYEEHYLNHIEQITSPAMGFEKAGEAYFSPDGETLSFQGVPTGESDYQIYTLRLKDRKLTRISTGEGACTCSFFHPKENRILFAMSPYKSTPAAPGTYKWDFTPYMNLYESDLDGSNRIQLTFGPAYHAECAYSPDGTKIVFASNESGSMNLYTMNRDGSNVTQVTFSPECYYGGPFFSPDGEKIVYRADPHTPHQLQIYTINTDGSDPIQLTDNGAVNWAPFWHPSGKAIAFTTSLHGHHQYQIYLLHLETGKTARLTYAPTFNGLPSFNADGSKIAWTSKRGPDTTSQIFIADFTNPFEAL